MRLFISAILLSIGITCISPAQASLSREEYNAALRKFVAFANTLAARKHAQVKVHTYWAQELVLDKKDAEWPSTPQAAAVAAGGAYAGLEDNNVWGITVVGGLVRHPIINEEGLLFILCHELGHNLTTRQDASKDVWFEAIADYYAGAQCLKRIFWTPEELAKPDDFRELPDSLGDACREGTHSPKEFRVCLRINKAGLNAAYYTDAYLRQFYPGQSPLFRPAFGRTGTQAGDRAQCRLETAFAASVSGPLPECARDPN